MPQIQSRAHVCGFPPTGKKALLAAAGGGSARPLCLALSLSLLRAAVTTSHVGVCSERPSNTFGIGAETHGCDFMCTHGEGETAWKSKARSLWHTQQRRLRMDGWTHLWTGKFVVHSGEIYGSVLSVKQLDTNQTAEAVQR